MFRFEHPYYLWLLLGLPLFLMVYWSYSRWKRKRMHRIDPRMVESLSPLRSKRKRGIRFFLFCLAFTCLAFALANPQIGSKMEEVKRKGVDIIVVLDISNSMMAEDLYPNRLERAKRTIEELFETVTSDRVGIIVFAGEAFVQLPITTDYAAAKLFLQSINTNLIGTQGTDIGRAVDLAVNSFDEESPTSKTIVLITDGENHEPNAVAAVEDAVEKGIVVHAIGMGSEKGAPIPVYRGSQKMGYRQSQEGNTVVSKLNEEMLREIAAAGKGIFVRATNSQSGLDYIFDEINRMEKVEFGSKVFTDYEDRFQYFLFSAILLLILESLIYNRKSIWLHNLFETREQA